MARIRRPRGGRSRVGGGRGRVVAGLVVAAVVAGLVLTRGPWPGTTYELHGSGVWLTNGDRIGRLNTEIPEIDYTRAGAPAALVQDGDGVLLVTPGPTTTVQRLNPADPEAEPQVALVEGRAVVAGGGGIVAALADGDVHVIGRAGVLDVEPRPLMRVGTAGVVAVGPEGDVAGYDPRRGTAFVLAAGATVVRRIEVGPTDARGEDLVLTLVGDEPFVLAGRHLLAAGHDPVDLGVGAAVQLPGPDAGSVLVATDDRLLEVDGDGSRRIVDRGGTGRPVRPVVHDGCAYGAWRGESGAGRFVVRCGDDEPSATELDRGGAWTFRTGGPEIVLNQTQDGTAWLLVDGTLRRVTTWPTDDERRSTSEVVQESEPDPDQKPPVAVADVGADRLGARPGRTTPVPVLHNDYDPNGDPLFVAALETDDDRLTVAPDGRALLVDLTAGTGGTESIRFRYRASDGLVSSTEWAPGEVEVVTGPGRPPRVDEGQRLTTTVAAGREITYDVLPALWDPDGDPLYLAGAGAPPGGHVVDAEPDGRLRFRASGRTGSVIVPVTVRDTFGQGREVSVVVTVAAPGNRDLVPEARNDFVLTATGRPTRLEPLANDHDPLGDGLHLDGAPEAKAASGIGGLGPLRDLDGAIGFTPQRAGDYVLTYGVEGSPRRGTILVRVVDPTGRPPVALPDVVLVESGDVAEVDALRNDIDPDGSLVSITAIAHRETRGADRTDPADAADDDRVPVDFGVGRDFRSVVADAPPDVEPGLVVELGYRISDGNMTGGSTITIVVVAARPNRPPRPVVPAPVVAVRAGDVATVALEDLVRDPDGDPLVVTVDDPPPIGEAVPNGDSVQYFAPASTPAGTTVAVTVVAQEPDGGRQPAYFTVRVVDPAQDSPPVAADLTARVRAGGTATIPVPLTGADPDGDWVRLLGRVGRDGIRGDVTTSVVDQALVYEAIDRDYRGGEAFDYAVVDGTGRESRPATVRVNVTGTSGNSPPVAISDRVVARPGRRVAVDPRANDLDIDGDPVRLVADSLSGTAGSCRVEADGSLVVVTVADGAIGCRATYSIVDVDDAGGARSTPVPGRIDVTVSTDFPGLRPVARDDFPEPTGGRVAVDVLANDFDPDGSAEALTAVLVGSYPGVTIDPVSHRLVAPVLDAPRMVRYRVTDGEGLSAEAVVRVPGDVTNRAPRLRADRPALRVRADQRLVVDLDRQIEDPDGDDVTFVSATSTGADSALLRRDLDRDRLVFQATSRDQVGPVTVHVTAVDDAPTPARAVLTLVVDVESPTNRPPTWTSGLECPSVERGATAAPIELRSYASDLDLGEDGTLVFSGSARRRGIEVEVTPTGRLTASATGAARVGDVVAFRLRVADRRGASDETTCEVEVTASRAATLTAAGATVAARQGRPVTVDVAPLVANAVGPVEIVGTEFETGTGKVAVAGTRLTYTSPPDQAGQVDLRYHVADSLDRPGDRRRTSAVITIQVAGRPDAPTNVVATAVASATVQLDWVNGNANGSPLDGFVASSVGGGVRVECSAHPCVLDAGDGIRNDVTYRFTVVATNQVGPSTPSAPSNEVRADTPPDAPTGLVAEAVPGGAGPDGQVRFTWNPSTSSGSPVTRYELSTGQATTGAETRAVVPGTNGVEVCASVVALNQAAGPGPASATACATPYGQPSIAGLAATVRDGDDRVTLTWTETGNGRPVSERSVTGDCTAVAVSAGQATLACPGRGRQEVAVTVTNSAGLRSEVARTTVDRQDPPTVTDATIAAGRESVEVAVSVEDGGAAIDRVVVELGSGPIERTGPGPHVLPAAPWEPVTLVSVVACRGSVCSVPFAVGATVVPWSDPPPVEAATVTRDLDGAGTPTGTATIAFDWARPAGSDPIEYRILVTPSTGGAPIVADGTNRVTVDSTDAAATWTIRIHDVTHDLYGSPVEVTLGPFVPGGR